MSDSRSPDRRRAKSELRQRRSAARTEADEATSTPQAATPEASNGRAAAPSRSHQAEPDTAQTDAAEPDTAETATAQPDTAQPDTTEPGRRVIVIEDESRPEAAGLNRLDEQQRPRRPWRPALDGTSPSRIKLLLVVLILAAAIVAGLLGWRALAADQVEDARTGATSAGRATVANVLSYDHNHLEADFAAASDGLTPSFRKEYEKTTADVVGPTARQYKAVVKASVVESAVVQAEADRVVLLMFVNQRTTSTRLEGPRADLARLRVTLVDADGWHVDDLDAL